MFAVNQQGQETGFSPNNDRNIIHNSPRVGIERYERTTMRAKQSNNETQASRNSAKSCDHVKDYLQKK